MISENLENENRVKYGEKNNDLIAKIERKVPFFAAVICAFSKIKYQTRISNGINKNGTDGEKIFDFDERLGKLCTKYNFPYFEDMFDYLTAKVIILNIWKRYKQ